MIFYRMYVDYALISFDLRVSNYKKKKSVNFLKKICFINKHFGT